MHSGMDTTDVNNKLNSENNIEKYSNQLWFDLREEHKNEIKKLSKILNIEPNWNVVDTEYVDLTKG
jgi:Mg2+ and Co2+ transporter CorA